MKSKSYFVDRIIKLRGGEGNRDELMKLQMVDILKLLNDERTKHAKPAEPDDIVDMIPVEKDDEEAPAPEKEETKEGEKQASPPAPESDSDDEGIVSIVKRFLFTPSHKD
jgi:hypothetical protein